MLIIGCDYHPSFQQIAFVDTETGECGERKLAHQEEAESFYHGLSGRSVRVGMEATGHAGWFERLLAELNFELWIGDPAEIRAKRVRKQKTDRRDAETLIAVAGEESLSTDLGTQSGESGSATTALAPTSAGADANQSQEPVAGHRPERRSATQERVVEQGGVSPVRVAGFGSLEQATPARFAGIAGPIEPQDRRAKYRDPARGGTTAGYAKAHDPSRSGTDHRTGLCVDPGSSRSVRRWQASRQLSGTDPVRGGPLVVANASGTSASKATPWYVFC